MILVFELSDSVRKMAGRRADSVARLPIHTGVVMVTWPAHKPQNLSTGVTQRINKSDPRSITGAWGQPAVQLYRC